jgi:hypothetical protein
MRAKERLQDDTAVPRKVFPRLEDKPFRLDCGDHLTFRHFLGNDVIILNGRRLKIICFECRY